MLAHELDATMKKQHDSGVVGELQPSNFHHSVDVGALSEDFDVNNAFSDRDWSKQRYQLHPPLIANELRRNIGTYPFTSNLASWAIKALVNYKPTEKALNLVKPFAAEFHEVVDEERARSTGLLDLNIAELIYQVSLEVGGALLLAATKDGDPVDLQAKFQSSQAGQDDHFSPWGDLLTGLECDPPIIAMFPIYLMMCEASGSSGSSGSEAESAQEDYVYATFSGVDWASGEDSFTRKFETFKQRALATVPALDDNFSKKDRSFLRIANAYLRAMNDCENIKGFSTPNKASINHGLDYNLVMILRGLDTISAAFMCSDGAVFLDDAGMDSMIAAGISNDVVDLHADIKTGETRNLLRLLYPDGLTIELSLQTMSTVFSGMLCELYRGHKRAQFENREDGRITAPTPAYSFCRARRRRIFATLETYTNTYPLFWDWTHEIYRRAKLQINDAGLEELLVQALNRARYQGTLSEVSEEASSSHYSFFDIRFALIEDGKSIIQEKTPLGVNGSLAQVIRDIHRLWNDQLLSENKQPGWGEHFDTKSDELFGKAGNLLGKNEGVSEEVYKFGAAYKLLSMTLPYLAYHTVGAIIMTFGAAS